MKKAILIALLLNSAYLQAQIKYFDIAPDKILHDGATGEIDTIDVRVAHDSSRYFINEAVRISIGGGQAWAFAGDSCSIAVDGANDAEAFPASTMIDGGRNWWSYAMLNDGFGNWVGVTDRYLGIRVKRNGKVFYGWIKMDVDATPTYVKIKDYAVNLTPGAMIKTGQKPENIYERTEESNTTLTLLGSSIHLSNAGTNDFVRLAVYDLTGKIVCNKEFYGDTTEIGILGPGLYVVSLYVNDRQQMIKVVKTEQ